MRVITIQYGVEVMGWGPLTREKTRLASEQGLWEGSYCGLWRGESLVAFESHCGDPPSLSWPSGSRGPMAGIWAWGMVSRLSVQLFL